VIDYSAALHDQDTMRFLKRLHGDIIPGATARGLNETAKAAQGDIREHVDDEMEIRRPAWVRASIKIPRFARKDRLQVAVRNEAPGDPTRSDILGQHELGDDKKPQGERLAVADPASKNAAGVVPAKKRPKALGMVEVGRGPKAVVYAGPKGIFMVKRIEAAGSAGGVYQRRGQGKRRKTGKGRGARAMAAYIDTGREFDANVVRLFHFIRKGTLKPALGFHKHGMAAVERTMVQNFAEAFDKAVARKAGA
jgi:hypothetical protein